MMNKIVLFNPRSLTAKPRLPNSILSVAASIDGKYDYVIVDGNFEVDPTDKLFDYFRTGEYKYFGCTCMPGPQLKQAIPISKKIREFFPDVKIIWGGYFPSNHSKVTLNSGYVDFIINGPGDKSFLSLINALENNQPYELINNLIYKVGDQIIKTKRDELYDLDALPRLPYDKLNSFYPIRRYLGKSYLGTKTIAYHSSFGCPFKCSFCGIVPIYNARWRGKSAEGIYKDIKFLKEHYGGNAIEFHDNNFFVSEKRVIDFSNLIMKENMIWWGWGRIDTVDRYSDETLALMRKSGCKMIFFGAESGNDKVLEQMDKGGTQTGAQLKAFAARMAKFDIIPEYSFVLGTPADTPEQVMEQIDFDISFIKEIKQINPDTEIIMYVYSPVPMDGTEMYNQVLSSGFHFPQTLEDWVSPHWENFDLRKNPMTPWLTPEMINKIKNFETVLNGYYPTVSDVRLSKLKRKLIRFISAIRYKTNFYWRPYELKALQLWWKYRQPEIEGF
ncbi:MAG TPA: radical SAM protein [Flavipsychrobacter sp.]|nr:radical SAM protein [Flavipsychrobacter sp.]